MNPICSRETRVASRSLRLPAIITVFNSILALVALLSMYLNVAQVKMTAELQYGSFLELYGFVAVIEFLMLVFLMPALTAGAISGERERQTLDIMMTTKVTRWDIVSGKLTYSLMVMFLVIVSSFPVLALVFVYGGISWLDLGLLILCYITSALLAGGIGICCSAIFRRSTVSTVIAYGMTALMLIGTYAVNLFANSLAGMSRINSSMVIQETARQTGSGGLLYLLLFNPSATFMMILNGQMKPSQIHVENWFGVREANIITEYWVPVSMAVQIAAAALFIFIAVKMMDPERLKRKHA